MKDGLDMLEIERDSVAKACKALSERKLVVRTAGNISTRRDDLIAISPSGLDYSQLTPELVCVCDLEGKLVSGPLAPSTELPLHLELYRHTRATAIVHTHAVASTALSAIVDELPALHYYMAMFGGSVRTAPYATFGTEELASNIRTAISGRTAALMSNHGAVVLGSDPMDAVNRSEYFEYLCDTYLKVLQTGIPPRLLSTSEISTVAAGLSTYGQTIDSEEPSDAISD